MYVIKDKPDQCPYYWYFRNFKRTKGKYHVVATEWTMEKNKCWKFETKVQAEEIAKLVKGEIEEC